MPDSIDLRQLFAEYWNGSFPNAPANKQSLESHVAFAQYVLLKTEALRIDDNQLLKEDT